MLEFELTIIIIDWVSSYLKIPRNNLADNTAKFAATLPPHNSLLIDIY
jgi:hypothetical protein